MNSNDCYIVPSFAFKGFETKVNQDASLNVFIDEDTKTMIEDIRKNGMHSGNSYYVKSDNDFYFGRIKNKSFSNH